ncbi:MAG TPA: hypothetical protein VKB51_17780 [bacterium]|nr:hypothetical protein [bacterium]
MIREPSPRRPSHRRSLSLTLCLLLGLVAGLALPAAAAQPAPPAAAAGTGAATRDTVVPPAPYAGYRVVEVSYLLRAPNGALVRVTRYGAPGADTGWDGHTATSGVYARRVFGLTGWISGWLFHAPQFYGELGDYVRESWATILRILDYLGVIVLFAGTWVIWFLVRPALIGLTDRQAFLLVFVAVGGLWLYVTQLYLSVVYALGLMLLPALVLGIASWGVRRIWRAVRGGPAGAAP